MAAAKKAQDERNEKAIRALLRLPENKVCVNCGSRGPQYVCTNFSTFVCTTCSGIHREFSHRIKSVSMATFTPDEVRALEAGGNKTAKETYLRRWTTADLPLPEPNSKLERIREFIRLVYVENRFNPSAEAEYSQAADARQYDTPTFAQLPASNGSASAARSSLQPTFRHKELPTRPDLPNPSLAPKSPAVQALASPPAATDSASVTAAQAALTSGVMDSGHARKDSGSLIDWGDSNGASTAAAASSASDPFSSADGWAAFGSAAPATTQAPSQADASSDWAAFGSASNAPQQQQPSGFGAPNNFAPQAGFTSQQTGFASQATSFPGQQPQQQQQPTFSQAGGFGAQPEAFGNQAGGFGTQQQPSPFPAQPGGFPSQQPGFPQAAASYAVQQANFSMPQAQYGAAFPSTQPQQQGGFSNDLHNGQFGGGASQFGSGASQFGAPAQLGASSQPSGAQVKQEIPADLFSSLNPSPYGHPTHPANRYMGAQAAPPDPFGSLAPIHRSSVPAVPQMPQFGGNNVGAQPGGFGGLGMGSGGYGGPGGSTPGISGGGMGMGPSSGFGGLGGSTPSVSGGMTSGYGNPAQAPFILTPGVHGGLQGGGAGQFPNVSSGGSFTMGNSQPGGFGGAPQGMGNSQFGNPQQFDLQQQQQQFGGLNPSFSAAPSPAPTPANYKNPFG